ESWTKGFIDVVWAKFDICYYKKHGEDCRSNFVSGFFCLSKPLRELHAVCEGVATFGIRDSRFPVAAVEVGPSERLFSSRHMAAPTGSLWRSVGHSNAQ